MQPCEDGKLHGDKVGELQNQVCNWKAFLTALEAANNKCNGAQEIHNADLFAGEVCD